MTKDLANIDETKRALEDVRLDIEKLERIKNQLNIHLNNLLTS